MILRCVQVIALGMIVGACAPVRDSSTENTIVNPLDDDASESALKVAYSMDDILAVEIGPEKLTVEPWKPVEVVLVGTLPDKTKGSVPTDVTWSITDNGVAIIGKQSGELIATKEGRVTISAKFRDFEAEREVKVAWLSKQNQTLPEPEALSASALDESMAQLKWRFGEDPVTGHQLAYKQGSAPVSCTSKEPGVTIIDASEIADLTEVTILGLASETTYGLRLCSVQELATEDQAVKRFSAGVVTSVTTTKISGDD